MAINPASLELRTGDTSIVLSGTSFVMRKSWEVYHSGLNQTIASGIETTAVPKLGDLDDADVALEAVAERKHIYIEAFHKPLDVIGDLSAFDADLVLDGWLQDTELVHPLCGTINAAPAGVVQRVNTIVAVCLPPPVWFWADSPAPGQIHVKAVPVSGATGYRVYDGDSLIASPSGAESTFAASAGDYVLRMAAYGTRLGILSFQVAVTVEAGGAMEAMPQAGVMDAAVEAVTESWGLGSVPEDDAEPAEGWFDRLKRRFRK